MIDRLAVAGYRSIRSLVLRLGALTVVTGPNGSGKTNLYRALKLIADTGDGQLIRSLAREGGFRSVLWAGPETISPQMISGDVPVQGTLRKKPISLRIGFSAEPFSYAVDVGIPAPSQSMFAGAPEIKRECVWRGQGMDAKYLCADRRGGTLRCRAHKGKWQDVDLYLTPHTSMLASYADPYAAPELILLREILCSWRFYDSFRTDADAPARRPAVGTFTPVISNDGSDLPAALQTIREIGDSAALDETIDDAFPGSQLRVTNTEAGMQLLLQQPGMLRELTAAELSDGTLRYLLLIAALLTPRPPGLMVLNEPENSLHPDLIPALSRLILMACENSQIVVVTHSAALIEQLESDDACLPIRLEKRLGETISEDSDLLVQHGWKWPAR